MNFVSRTSPYIRNNKASVVNMMKSVVYALLPVTFCALYVYGIQFLATLVVAFISIVGTEYVVAKMFKGENTIYNFTAVITAMIYALILTAGTPLWVVFLGGLFATIFAKLVFGGMGNNIFNPAAIARVFVLVSFGAVTMNETVVEAVGGSTPLATIAGDGLNYANNLRDLSWNVDAGYQHEVYNWYGVSPIYTDTAMLDDINPKHKFFTFDFGGEIEFDNSLFNKTRARFTRFADDYDSAENRFEAIANINIPISGEEVKTDVKIDYLGGTFDNDYFGFNKIKYGNFQVGISPNYQIKEDDLTVNLGFSAYYLNDTEASENKFFIYPKITASYRLVDEVLITYAGIEGDLIQNSYRDLASLNPFLSPTLFIVPTDQQYNAFIGKQIFGK
mgnify:CR=1 FL=1